jgi:Protein of unknown function (DUF447)
LPEILAEIERLQGLVTKTGGPREHEAMAFIRSYLAQRTRVPVPP